MTGLPAAVFGGFMNEGLNADLCVIGGGSGGLSVAAGASQMGAEVVLIEKGKMGGDCLNYGCVPSKSIIAAGHAADVMRRSGRFGVGGEYVPEAAAGALLRCCCRRGIVSAAAAVGTKLQG